jgi:hypothetical protein
MSRIRSVVSGLTGAGILLGLFGVPGCGDPEEGVAPKLKGSKDEIQKAMFKGQEEKSTTTKKN